MKKQKTNDKDIIRIDDNFEKKVQNTKEETKLTNNNLDKEIIEAREKIKKRQANQKQVEKDEKEETNKKIEIDYKNEKESEKNNLFEKDNLSDFNLKEFSKREQNLQFNEEFTNEKKASKSKFSIFLLIVTLLVLIYQGICLGLNFTNLDRLELIKSGSFLLISFLIVLILLKVSNKKTTPYVIILTLVLISYSLFSTSYSAKEDVYVLNFVNKDVSEVIEWADEFGIELNILHDFSDTVLKNHVILQEYDTKTLVKDIKSLEITISDGPNYDKTITIPNLTGFTYDEVMDYIEKNHLVNVEIEFIESEAKRDTVVEQVGSGALRRNDKIIFKFSYGNEEFESIAVKDLTNLSEFAATSYLKRYKIPYEIIYEFDDKILKGYVIKQSVVNEIVQDKLTLTISKGKQIIVPNLIKMTTKEISKWASENNINITYEEKYSKEYEAGVIIDSSLKEGDKVASEDTITITISKGSMKMPKVENLAEFKLWASENNINFEEVYEFSTEYKNGEIIKTSPNANEKLDESDTVIITISKGGKVTIPSFIGLSKSAINEKCKSLKLSCTFSYGGYSETVKKDIATKQSKAKGTVVSEGSNVAITLSSGIIEKVNVPSFVGKSKSQITASCNSLGVTCKFTYAKNYSNEAKDTAISQDKTGNVNKGSTINVTLSLGPAKSYTIVIYGGLLTQGNPEATKKTLENLLSSSCPGVNFTYTFQKVLNGIGYLNSNSDVKVGQNTFVQGKTYTVIINSAN